jgi:DNA-binding LytR/AlgR family response regulator
MHLALCDDSKSDRQDFKEKLHVCLDGNHKISEYSCAEALIADVQEEYENFDIIFLDILMDGMNGLDAAKRLRQMGCRSKIIFVSYSDEFALESYEVASSGYLLKPVRQDKLKMFLDRIIQNEKRSRIELRHKGNYTYLYTDEILWAESQNNQVLIYLKNAQVYTQRKKLDEIEEMIHDENFLRCHQSYLINMNYVKQINDCFEMSDGAQIPIRVRSRKKILDQYHAWFHSNI